MLGRLRLVDPRHVLGRRHRSPCRRQPCREAGRRRPCPRRPCRRRPCRQRLRRPRPRPPSRRRRRAGRQRGQRRRVVGSRARIGAGGGAPSGRAASSVRDRIVGVTPAPRDDRPSPRVGPASGCRCGSLAPATPRCRSWRCRRPRGRLASTIVVDPVEPRRGGAADTSALIMPGSALVGRAPDGRAPADDVPAQLAAVAWAHPTGARESATACRCGCRRAAASRASGGGSIRCNSDDLVGRQRSSRSVRVDAGPPQHLVDEHVAETGHRRLVEQHRLHRRPPTLQRRHQLARVSGSGRPARGRPSSGSSQIRPNRRGSWKRSRVPSSRAHDPAVPAASSSSDAVLEALEGDSRVVSQQPPGHAEVQPDRRPVGEQRQHLAPPVEPLDRGVDEGLVDPAATTIVDRCARRPRTAGRRAGGRPSGELDLEDLWHGPKSGQTRFAMSSVRLVRDRRRRLCGAAVRRLPHRAALGGQGRQPLPHDVGDDRPRGQGRQPPPRGAGHDHERRHSSCSASARC